MIYQQFVVVTNNRKLTLMFSQSTQIGGEVPNVSTELEDLEEL